MQESSFQENIKVPDPMVHTNIPTKIFNRNKFGLLENFNYKFTPEGLIDWRALISKEHLYINSQNKERIEKNMARSMRN